MRGEIVAVEALVCERQRLPQFPLRPYTPLHTLLPIPSSGRVYAVPCSIDNWDERIEALLYGFNPSGVVSVILPRLLRQRA